MTETVEVRVEELTGFPLKSVWLDVTGRSAKESIITPPHCARAEIKRHNGETVRVPRELVEGE